MGSQPNLASSSEVVSIYKCPQKCGLSPIFGGANNIQFLTTFFAISTLDTAYLRNETLPRQTKMLVSIYNVSPKSWHTFRDLWPRNGWDPFAHCDPPFGDHYVATVMVATCLVYVVSCFRWYHGRIERVVAENLLKESGQDSFLVRESEAHPGDYTIAVHCHNQTITSVRVDYKVAWRHSAVFVSFETVDDCAMLRKIWNFVLWQCARCTVTTTTFVLCLYWSNFLQ